MNRNTLLFVIALLVALPSGLRAQTDSYYHCNRPSDPGNVLMVPVSETGWLRDKSGFVCNLLDIDYASSKGRACYLAWQFPQNNWFEWNPDDPAASPYQPMTCP